MDFNLSAESKMMVKAARDFAEQIIEPVVAQIEEDDALHVLTTMVKKPFDRVRYFC